MDRGPGAAPIQSDAKDRSRAPVPREIQGAAREHGPCWIHFTVYNKAHLLGAVVLSAAIAACAPPAEDGSAGAQAVADQSDLRALIMAANAPPTPAEQAPAQTGEDTQVKTDQGASQDCVYKRFTGTELYETLVSFEPNADSIWPGAIVQTKQLPDGLAAPIGLERRPGTITLGDAVLGDGQPGVTYSRTLATPSLASTRDGIASILSTDGVKIAAKSSYLAETAYSMNEAALKIGVSASWMSGSVKASFDGSWMTKKTTMVVRFIQAYYTVSFASPDAPEKVFAPTVHAADAKPYMGPGNPPGYVSSVTYGRMLIMKIESDDSESDLRAALDLVFSKVNVDAAAHAKTVLQNSSISVFVLGGSPEDASRLQSADTETRTAALAAYIENGAGFSPASPGVPISYTVRRLADNETIKVASTIDYQVPVCTPSALQVSVGLDRLFLHKDGKAGGSTTGEYEVWVETSASQGGAAPPTPGQADQTKRDVIAKGTSPMDDDSAIPLGQSYFAQLAKQQGATFTIGARVKSYAKNKECEMTRQHGFRFNPQTNKGEWTNVGKNVLSCAAADSAFLGDNSLDVDLEYAVTPAP